MTIVTVVAVLVAAITGPLAFRESTRNARQHNERTAP